MRYRDGRIRTGDPLLPKQVRYQAAPRPVARFYWGCGGCAHGHGSLILLAPSICFLNLPFNGAAGALLLTSALRPQRRMRLGKITAQTESDLSMATVLGA